MVTRIRKLLEHKQLTPTQFADLIGVGRPVMSHILSERNKPSLEVVQRIISAFPELSLPWLLNGVGEMLAGTNETLSVTSPAPVLAPEPSPVPNAPESEAPAPVLAPASPTPEVLPEPAAGPPPQEAARASSSAVRPAAPPAVPAAEAPTVRPFRAARFVPRQAQAAPSAPAAPPETVTAPVASAAAPPLMLPAAGPVPMPTASALTTAPASGVVAEKAPEAALLPFMAEPGKAIRRIVIFYRDGSFSDYQPEQ